MKQILCAFALMALMLDAHATLYTETFNSGASVGVIPDAGSGGAVGVYFTGNVSDIPSGSDGISDISISLNISGGYNHDLYAYLRSPDGTVVTLMNQPGSLYTSGSGFNIILGISGTSIQTATQTSGAVFGDGVTMYQSADSMTAFYGHNASGTWTLYFQDLSPGDTSTLNSWTLNITPVPEPAGWGMFTGIVLIAFCTARTFRSQKLETGKKIV